MDNPPRWQPVTHPACQQLLNAAQCLPAKELTAHSDAYRLERQAAVSGLHHTGENIHGPAPLLHQIVIHSADLFPMIFKVPTQADAA